MTVPVAGAVGFALELEDFGLQTDHLEEVVDAWPVLAYVAEDGLAAPLFGLKTELDELALHALGVGARLVDLVDRDDDRNVRALGVGDRFFGLRHDAVVGGDDER